MSLKGFKISLRKHKRRVSFKPCFGAMMEFESSEMDFFLFELAILVYK